MPDTPSEPFISRKAQTAARHALLTTHGGALLPDTRNTPETGFQHKSKKVRLPKPARFLRKVTTAIYICNQLIGSYSALSKVNTSPHTHQLDNSDMVLRNVTTTLHMQTMLVNLDGVSCMVINAKEYLLN